MSEDLRFKVDKDFEEAMCMFAGAQFIGSKYKSDNPEFIKESLLKLIRVFKRSINKNKTMDKEIKFSLRMRLDNIEKKIRVLNSDENDDWNIIYNLLIIVSLLYGYEDGKVVREVVYSK